MSTTLWQGVVKSISEREGVDVTATVTRRSDGVVEIAYSFDDHDQQDTEELPWDCFVAAHIAEQLALVQRARRACEALKDANERLHDAYDHDEIGELDNGTDEQRRAETAHAQALVEYEKAMTALPHSLL